MTDNRAVHIIDLLQRLLGIFDGILQALIAIKSDTAAILVGVNQIVGNTASAVTALNNIITLINTSNTNLSNITTILNSISTELQAVKTNLDTLVQQGTNTYNQLLVLIDKVEALKVSQDAFYAAVLKYEDNASLSGDAGIQSLSVRRDNLSSLTSAEGDYQTFNTNRYGELFVANDGVPFLQSDVLANTPSAGITTEYYGFALTGTATNTAAWKIMKVVTQVNGSIARTFADGNQNFDNIWDNRTGLTYS